MAKSATAPDSSPGRQPASVRATASTVPIRAFPPVPTKSFILSPPATPRLGRAERDAWQPPENSTTGSASKERKRMNRETKGRNRPALALHVPEPDARPGDEVDFSHIPIPPAGSAPRPDVAAPAAETRDLCYGLIRVLDEEEIGRASCRE